MNKKKEDFIERWQFLLYCTEVELGFLHGQTKAGNILLK
jgi:hypothetical protein